MDEVNTPLPVFTSFKFPAKTVSPFVQFDASASVSSLASPVAEFCTVPEPETAGSVNEWPSISMTAPSAKYAVPSPLQSQSRESVQDWILYVAFGICPAMTTPLLLHAQFKELVPLPSFAAPVQVAIMGYVTNVHYSPNLRHGKR